MHWWKKRYLAYTAAAVCICAAPFALMSVHATTWAVGNEEPAAWPSLWAEDGSLNGDYLAEAGEFLEDRIAFRPQLITVDSKIRDKVFGVSSQENVIAGTDGWLYYAATLDDYQHDNNVSGRMLFNEAHNLRLLQDYVAEQGGTFVFTIAPNKNTLYGEHMPAQYRVQVAEQSDFERLIPYLESEGIHYVDLVGLFRAQTGTLYYARDSHWNEEGAVLVYDALLSAAGQAHEDYQAVVPTVTHDYYGDLGKMLYPAGAEPEDALHYLTDPTWTYTGDTTSVEENYIETVNPEGEAGRLLMYRDSFGNSLLPYMAQAYRDAVFSKNVPYDIANDLADEAGGSADTVIVERVERHLPTLAQAVPVMPAPAQDYILDFEEDADEDIAEETGEDAPETAEEDGTEAAGGTDAAGATITAAGSADGRYVVLSGQIDADLAGENARILYPADR